MFSTVHNPETYYSVQRGRVLPPTLERRRGMKAGTSPRTPLSVHANFTCAGNWAYLHPFLYEYLLVEAVSFVPGCPDPK